MTTGLELRGLRAGYGPVEVLHGIDASFPAGSIVAVIGQNGAGTSTLMRCIATLQTPTSGRIRFGDIDVLRQPEALRATLGYLPQDFGVYPRVSAWDLLSHLAVLKGIEGRGERREVVERLEQVRPSTLGHAGRVPGVTPAAVAVLAAFVGRHRIEAAE